MKISLYRLGTLVTALFLISLSAACSGNFIPITGNTAAGGNLITLSECYQIRFLGLSRDVTEGSTTWQYQVEELSCAVQDLSEWRLEIPVCATILEASPSHWEVIQNNADLEANGLQWKMDSDFQGGIYTVKLSGALMRGSIQVGVNGPDTIGLIQGPVCDPNAPTPTITFTPGSPTPTPTVTATLRPTTSPAGTGTATVLPGPFVPETQEPDSQPTKRSTSALTKTSTPTPTKTATPKPEEDSTPMPTNVTPLPTAVTPDVTQEATTEPGSLPTEDAPTLAPTDVIPTLTGPTETIPEVLNITENDEILTYACDGDAVEISGNVNVVTLVGECSSITITGNNNRVYWEEGSPVLEDTGNDNTIDQQ